MNGTEPQWPPRSRNGSTRATSSSLLGKLVPKLELLRAHSKTAAAEIDEAMVRFGRGDGDVLVATNIIEAGLAGKKDRRLLPERIGDAEARLHRAADMLEALTL